MAAIYSVTSAPRCCGELLTCAIPYCECIVCGKQYPFQEIADFFYSIVLPTLPIDDGIRIKKKINQMYLRKP